MLNFTLQDPSPSAQGCVIWMHGLGADASDMEGLAKQSPIGQLPLRHVFVNAPVRKITINAGMLMRGWYDILGFKQSDRCDTEGILQSQAEIEAIIAQQMEAGFKAQQIILAGFSQGGTMALLTALSSELDLGGVIALSAYLPPIAGFSPRLPKETPIFMGYGQFDTLILPEWTQLSNQLLIDEGYHATILRQYPMEHAICMEEINDIINWLTSRVKGVHTE